MTKWRNESHPSSDAETVEKAELLIPLNNDQVRVLDDLRLIHDQQIPFHQRPFHTSILAHLNQIACRRETGEVIAFQSGELHSLDQRSYVVNSHAYPT